MRAVWEEFGLKALARDRTAWLETLLDDLVRRSPFICSETSTRALMSGVRRVAVCNRSNRFGRADIVSVRELTPNLAFEKPVRVRSVECLRPQRIFSRIPSPVTTC
jgi:hypothetical protein